MDITEDANSSLEGVDQAQAVSWQNLSRQGLPRAVANSGGQAKLMIADGLVKLNGKVETQKSKKILSGDIIEFQAHKLEMLLKAPEETAPESVEPPADLPPEPPAEA